LKLPYLQFFLFFYQRLNAITDMKNFSILAAFFCLILNAYSSASGIVKRTCKTVIPPLEWKQNFQSKVEQLRNSSAANRVNASYTIPVVVHVVYWNSMQNISQAQVNSQIQILNADYNGTGANVGNCPTAFKSLIANTNINFCLAQVDPNGATLAEPGIDRVSAQAKSFTNPGSNGWSDFYIDSRVKPATIWDPTKYMNIWVVPMEEDILGYATFPRMSTLSGLDAGGSAQDDGVVIGYLYFGNTGTVSYPYDMGRTATHEVGHWLGLLHISGDEECGNDYCSDTPSQIGNAGDGSGLNYGCPNYPYRVNGCGSGASPNGELFMDFMDYTDDACMFMFTNDQRTRMQTAMLHGTYRLPLTTSTVCSAGTATVTASFTASDTVVCAGGSLIFTNASVALTGSPDSVRWTINGGTPFTSSSASSVTAVFNTAGSYTISLVAYKGGTGSVAYTKSIRVKAKPAVTVNSPSICSGKTATLTASGASSYAWSNSLGSTASVTTPALTANTTYTVTGTTSGCTNSASATVIVKSNPAVSVNSPAICSGATATLTASGASAYSWTGSLGANATVVTPALTTSTTYVVTGTSNGCTNSATATVTVRPKPAVTVNSPSVCSGETATLAANGATTYAWSNSLGSTATVTTPPLTAGTSYTVTGTLNSCTNTATATVTVKPKPSVAVNSPSICSGKTAALTASGATSYSWSNSLGTTASVTTPALSSNTTYTVTGTTNGCTNRATATVTVKPNPAVSVNSPTICSGQTATLTATGAGAYSWTPNIGTSATVTTPALTATTTYAVTGTTNGCSQSATAVVTVSTVAPTIVISPNPASVCLGNSITLTANGANAYTWDQPGATGNTITLTPSAALTLNVSGTLTGCTNAGHAAVSIAVLSKPTVAASNVAICSGQIATLAATGASTYSWSNGLGNTATVTTPVLTATTSYTVTGNSNGCTNTASATVTVKPLPATPVITQSTDTLRTTASGNQYTWYFNGTFLQSTNVPYLKINQPGAYKVEASSNGCTSLQSAVYNAVLTGLRVHAIQLKYSILPNPNNGSFELLFSAEKSSTYKLYVYNVTGQVMHAEQLDANSGENSRHIDLTGIGKGMYLVTIITDDGVGTQNIIVQ
jgi:hypothetical protein